jgi:type IV pilus assembly protein PilQ
VIDPRTNTLFINDVSSKLEEIRSLLKITDVPSRQVLIESRIVEATDTFAKNLGARLGFFNMPCTFTNGTQQVTQACQPYGGGTVKWAPSGNIQSTGVQTGQATNYAQSFYPDSFSVNLPATNITGSTPSQWSLSLFNAAATRFVNLEISALQVDGYGKIISSPRVITADNVEATIEQGTEIPYQQATSSGATSISFRKATLSLKVKPQITPDDNVIMTLAVNKDSVGQTTTAGPSIDTKRVSTEVLVENGGTVSLGGIYQQDQERSVQKVPLLGDLPVLGFMFKSERNSNTRSELLIFVSPKIIRETVSSAR